MFVKAVRIPLRRALCAREFRRDHQQVDVVDLFKSDDCNRTGPRRIRLLAWRWS